MKKTDLISKWLNFNLSDNELEAFNNLDASGSYRKIADAARHFKSPDFNSADSYLTLQQKLIEQKKTASWKRYISGIAAALVICFGIYYFLNTPATEYLAENKTTTEFLLPDASKVVLNAGSSISFKEENWSDNRSLKLNGEAYFSVAKGEKFTVNTKQGSITVLGTEFKVNDRPGFFEVTCYEGLVSVHHNNQKIKLPSGNTYKFFGNKVVNETITTARPGWLSKKSIFKSVPYNQVIDELERQYDIRISGDATNEQTLFSGSFSHENLEIALQAITIPLNLSYTINGKNVVFKND